MNGNDHADVLAIDGDAIHIWLGDVLNRAAGLATRGCRKRHLISALPPSPITNSTGELIVNVPSTE